MGRPMTFETDTAIDRAMAVFWRSGYAGTTPQALLDELGIGKGSFYNTFESKHKLFTAALERYKDKRIVFLGEVFGPPGPVRDRLEFVLHELSGLDDHKQGCLMVNSVTELAQDDESVQKIADDLFTGIEAAFRDVVERGRESGEFSRTTDPQRAAASLLTTLIGASVLLKLGSDPARAVSALHDAVESL
jgi:TetR/AcrR family transcriptional repressor of nem operon